MFTPDSIVNGLIAYFTQPDANFYFSTMKFLVLFVLFFAIYLLLKKSKTMMITWTILFGFFIAYLTKGWQPLFVMPALALLSWSATEWMKDTPQRRNKRLWLTFIILIDLLPLVLFKYANFIINSYNDLFAGDVSILTLIEPLGISYFTFQAISYSIDSYRGLVNYKVSWLEYMFYITFFPLLFSGPITRINTLIPQLKAKGPVNGNVVNLGLWLIVLGLVKQGVIATYLADFNTMVFTNPDAYSGFEVLMAALGFTMQIYCNFSGCSDIAIGLAGIMGFRLPANFNAPYKSLNITEFWRRWHIALSSWFRDYLYIPLGGNRKGKFRTYLNVFITMVVSGLWHGAAMAYIIWGALHGVASMVHKACKSLFLDRIRSVWYWNILWWAITFVFLVVTWVFFRAGMPDANGMDTVGQMFDKFTNEFDWAYLPVFFNVRWLWTILLFVAILFHFTPEKIYDKVSNTFASMYWLFQLVLFVYVVQLVINFSQEGVPPNLYAQY